MIRSELIQKYADFHHLRFLKGGPEDISVLMPYLIMDVGYQYYCHDIQTLKVEQGTKRAKGKWRDSYLAFNRTLIAPYNTDERIEINDMMDAMHDALANDLMILQVSAMNVFQKEFNFNQQKILSSVFMTNRLALIAQNTWRTMFRHDNNNINGVLEWSLSFSDNYMRSFGKNECKVEEKDVKELKKCSDILVNKLTDWLINENKKGK